MRKKMTMLSVFLLLINLVIPFITIGEARAQGSDISNRNVTQLSVSPKTVNDGSNFKVRVEFDDKAGKIQNGDIIKVNWPNQSDVKIEGYNKTIDLTVQNQVVGQVVITSTGATITFNNNIDRLSDVSGFAEFEAQARNLTNTNEADDKNAIITSGGKSDTLTIHKGASGTESVFYYKTGDMVPNDTDHVRWFLNVNTGKKYAAKDVTIKDQIQGGQTLDLSSFNITIEGTHSRYFDGPNAISDFEKYIPGSKVKADPTTNTIEVSIPQGYVSNNSFSFHYKTTITDTNQKAFDNHSQAWYQEHGQNEVNGESFNYTVANISANAGITGTVKGELKILKKDKDTKKPIENVKFKLVKADGSVIKEGQTSINLTTDAQGIANIKGLPVGVYNVTEIEAPESYQFDSNKVYSFELKDSDTEGHFFEIENQKKTVANKDVTATKVWKDGQSQHPTIYFKLFQKGTNNQEVPVANAETKALESGTTEVTWQGLPEVDKDGQAIEYFVHEVDKAGNESTPIGYVKEEKGLTVTNTAIPKEKTAISVSKDWDDKDNQDGKRPDHITVQLYKSVQGNEEKVGTPVLLNASQQWSHTWNDLIKQDENGEAMTYFVKEINVPEGYQSSIKKINETHFNITNHYEPEMTKVEGQKVWEDKNNQDGKRPDNVTVNLLANGEKIKEVEVSEATDWKYVFDQLPKYENGKKINYTVTENHVDDYSTKIEGTTITNEYTPGETTATVTKNWQDEENRDGKRPDAIKVELYADDQATGQKALLSEANNWTHTWAELAEKANGKAIKYSVKEITQVEGYQSTVNHQDSGNIIITNHYEPEMTQVEGQKVWEDKNNQDGKRPDNVTVNLLANGEKIKEVEVSEATDWKYAFDQLPKYENGKEINYTVTENHVDDYSTKIEGTTITNEYTPGETTATVTKNWQDEDNKYEKRPKAIRVQLYANGDPQGEMVVLNDENDWTYTWKELAEKMKGETVVYSVKEVDKIKGYQMTVDNQDHGNMMITNTYTEQPKPEKQQPEKPKPEAPEKDTPRHPKPNQPDTSEPQTPIITKTPENKQSEKPSIIGFLPDTGQMMLRSWVTWVGIVLLIVLGILFIIKRNRK